MKYVYLVIEDKHIYGVFSSEDKAKSYIREIGDYNRIIEEWTIDYLLEQNSRRID